MKAPLLLPPIYWRHLLLEGSRCVISPFTTSVQLLSTYLCLGLLLYGRRSKSGLQVEPKDRPAVSKISYIQVRKGITLLQSNGFCEATAQPPTLHQLPVRRTTAAHCKYGL